MKLTLRRYSFLLTFQIGLLVVDLMLNSFAQCWIHKNINWTILMFVLQDMFIIVEYLLFTLALHSTCAYEVGASHIILQRCKLFLCVMLVYFLLSASEHFWIVYNLMWTLPTISWSGSLNALYFVQRLVSFVYYYTYKRTALLIADPRYEESNIDWIAAQI